MVCYNKLMIKILIKYKEIIFKNEGFIFTLVNLFNRSFGMNSFRVKRNNKCDFTKSLMTKSTVKIIGENNKIVIDRFSLIKKCNITIHGNNNEVKIGEKSYLDGVNITIEDDNNLIAIGSSTTIYSNNNLSALEGTNLVIGDNCLFSSNIEIRTSDSHSVIDMNSNQRINHAKNIVIGNHVWIGTNVTILKGSEISDNSIIGTQSLVNKAFNTTNCVIAGNPAKIVKKSVNWDPKQI